MKVNRSGQQHLVGNPQYKFSSHNDNNIISYYFRLPRLPLRLYLCRWHESHLVVLFQLINKYIHIIRMNIYIHPICSYIMISKKDFYEIAHLRRVYLCVQQKYLFYYSDLFSYMCLQIPEG